MNNNDVDLPLSHRIWWKWLKPGIDWAGKKMYPHREQIIEKRIDLPFVGFAIIIFSGLIGSFAAQHHGSMLPLVIAGVFIAGAFIGIGFGLDEYYGRATRAILLIVILEVTLILSLVWLYMFWGILGAIATFVAFNIGAIAFYFVGNGDLIKFMGL